MPLNTKKSLMSYIKEGYWDLKCLENKWALSDSGFTGCVDFFKDNLS